MSATGDTPPDEDQLFEEAAAWFARMRSPDAEASGAAFDEWLARGALHRKAYNRATEVFALGKLLGDEDPPVGGTGRATRDRRILTLATVAVMLAGFTGLWLALGPPAVPGKAVEVAELAAGPTQRSVRVADGSAIELEPGTLLLARFDAGVRQLTLRRGKALFRVAHEQRPFVVLAGGGSVTARGTVFAVELAANRHVAVRLFEGAIDVRLPMPDARGETVRHLRRSGTVAFPPADGSAAAAPSPAPGPSPTDANDFVDVRLADLVNEANRDSKRPIRFAEPALAERRISGRFRIEDGDLLAERIAVLFGLAVDRSDPAVLILRPK